METTPSDRVQLIDRGSLMHPGCCALCGSGNCQDGYVDTGIYYDYEGQVYFCMTCALQITNVIGGFSIDEVSIQKNLLDDTVAELSSVKTELENANARLGHYDAIMSDLVSTRNNGDDSPSGDVSKDAQEQPGTTDAPAKSADEAKPVVVKSGSGTRRTNTTRTQRRDSGTANAGFTN